MANIDIILTDHIIPPGPRKGTLTMLHHPDIIGFLAAQEYLTWLEMSRELRYMTKVFKDYKLVCDYDDVAS